MQNLHAAFILFLLLQSSLINAKDIGIGEEVIKPIKYPKFNLSYDYSHNRVGTFLGENGFDSSLNDLHGASLSFDVGLYRYLNAGAVLSSSFGVNTKMMTPDPMEIRFSLFLKPLISFFDRISIFSRMGAGLSLMANNPVMHLQEAGSETVRNQLAENFQNQMYGLLNPGANAFATIGVEYFPISRFGIAVDWGIRADIYYITKSALFGKPGESLYSEKAPNSITYLSYGFPLNFTLNFIL